VNDQASRFTMRANPTASRTAAAVAARSGEERFMGCKTLRARVLNKRRLTRTHLRPEGRWRAWTVSDLARVQRWLDTLGTRDLFGAPGREPAELAERAARLEDERPH